MNQTQRQFYGLTFLISALGITPAVLFFGISWYFHHLATQAEIWKCSCGVVEMIAHPRAGTLSSIFVVMGGIWTLWLILRTTALLARHDRETGKLRKNAYRTTKFQNIAIHMVRSEIPQAVTVGILRPSIFVTDGTQTSLTSAEYDAVIAHEVHHVRRGDPLLTIMVGVVAHAYGWVRFVCRLAEQWTVLREVTADHAATNGYTDARGLAGALLKMSAPEITHAAAFSPNLVRIDALLYPKKPIYAFPWKQWVLGIVALTTVVSFGVHAGTAWASAPSKTTIQQCQEIHHMCRELQAKSVLMFSPRAFSGYVLP